MCIVGGRIENLIDSRMGGHNDMGNIPASVFILTKNSAKTIRRALESVKDFDDIVICDGGSTDETIKISKDYGVKIYSQARECLGENSVIRDYSCARNNCFKNVKYDWVVYIDSDEEMSKELVEDIRRVVSDSNPAHFLWKFPCRVVVDGKEIFYSSNYPGYQIRFFNKKTGAEFVKSIHEKLKFDESKYSVGTFRGAWRYFVSKKDLLADFPHYFSIEKERAKNWSFGKRLRLAANSIIIAIKIIIKSLRNYLLYGFKDSMPPSFEWSRIRYQLILIRILIFRI